MNLKSCTRSATGWPSWCACCLLGWFSPVWSPAAEMEAAVLERGAQVYRQSCAACHGEQGQGVAGSYAEPLVGDESVGQLTQRIDRTMPEGEPEKCVGADAQAVAAYIHHTFYSEAAQVRNRPPRISLQRLTANQLRQSLADLYEQFAARSGQLTSGGLSATYYDSARARGDSKKFERIDEAIDFDFAHAGPGGDIKPEEFSIRWEGGLQVKRSGRYEIIVRSTCSFEMDLGRIDRQFIDNRTQSGDKTEFRQSLMLTAGRTYPIKIDFVQRKRKTAQPPARISLAWVPPGGVEQIIPPEHLVREVPPPTFALQTPLPPDDRSYGFERGVAINREWDESTTAAALEFAQIAHDELWPAYAQRNGGRNDSADKRRQTMHKFLQQLLSTAFRQPLDDQLLEIYISKQLAAEADDAEALKRVVLLALKSPRFLYPLADADQSPSQRVANRVCLTLYDSLPSEQPLLTAIQRGEFASEQQVREYVIAHLGDPRLQAKSRAMLVEWLNIGQFADISKDNQHFSGFASHLVDDLRRSLEAQLDDLVWQGDGDFRRAFTSQQVYTTRRIADFYGADWQPAGADASQLPLDRLVPARPQPAQAHLGILTHPYLLSGLAYHDASSPIHRGVFLIRYLLGRTLRPPADAFSPLSPDLHPELTTRQRVELQTSPESCQVCHQKINGLGFTLENYDAAGRFRTTERERPIDPSGEYVARNDELQRFSGAPELANYLAHSPDAQRALVNRAFQFFVKQPPAAYGPATSETLLEKFVAAGCNVRELLVEIAVHTAVNPIE